ncbi:MAG: glutaminyl-peptide cyclotransferase [Thermotogales bacterium]|nr:glutaminyl-peptide cyclotransferase [Thermotogales bacterium]
MKYSIRAICLVTLLMSLAVSVASGDCGAAVPASDTSRYHYDIIKRIPHDQTAFTQGLVFYQGKLYESTGLRGESSVRRINPETGTVEQSGRLPGLLFGEGLTVWKHRLLQLTWTSGTGLIHRPGNLSEVGRFRYSGEGWGAAVLDGQLVISDGSSRLRFLDPNNFSPVSSLRVSDQGHAVDGLNELETVDGLIFANIYPGDCIAGIDPESGKVVSWIDLAGLMPLSSRPRTEAVTNGIAYNPENGHWFVTGKLWPYIYEIKIREVHAVPDKQAALHASRMYWRS